MSADGYKIRNQAAIHFLTFTVVDPIAIGWVDVFTRKDYRDIVLDSIRHCQSDRGLWLHCWCIMSNHMHLIASATSGDLSDIIRDFKKFTSTQLVSAIAANERESRKSWMLRVFSEQGSNNSRNSKNQFWRQDNHPIELYSPLFVAQKMNYIHNNPVEAGIVRQPWDYLYSSAIDYHTGKKCGLLDLRFL